MSTVLLYNFALAHPFFVIDIIILVKITLNLVIANCDMYILRIFIISTDGHKITFHLPILQFHSSTLNTFERIYFTYFIKYILSYSIF